MAFSWDMSTEKGTNLLITLSPSLSIVWLYRTVLMGGEG
jgi:hypothetical protein